MFFPKNSPSPSPVLSNKTTPKRTTPRSKKAKTLFEHIDDFAGNRNSSPASLRSAPKRQKRGTPRSCKHTNKLCKLGKERHPITKCCVSTCKSGIRNPAGRCVRLCDRGSSGRCLKTCKAGRTRNSKTNRCLKTKK